jgi:uncharacterized protein (UPF0548 family)
VTGAYKATRVLAPLRRVYIGESRAVFNAASEMLMTFEYVKAVPWVSVHTLSPAAQAPRKGQVLATHVKAYNLLWTLNPCKFVCVYTHRRAPEGKTISQVSYSTVRGHLISGEERCRVVLERTGKVSRRATAYLPYTLAGISGSFLSDQRRRLARYTRISSYSTFASAYRAARLHTHTWLTRL